MRPLPPKEARSSNGKLLLWKALHTQYTRRVTMAASVSPATAAVEAVWHLSGHLEQQQRRRRQQQQQKSSDIVNIKVVMSHYFASSNVYREVRSGRSKDCLKTPNSLF